LLEALLSKFGQVDKNEYKFAIKNIIRYKMTIEILEKGIFNNFKPYLQDTFSLGIALFVSGSLYYYKKYNDHSWMRIGWILCIFYAINDLYNGASVDFWMHHIAQIVLCSIITIWGTSANKILNDIYYCLLVEISTIFLSFKSLMRTYLKKNIDINLSPLKILKQLKPINEYVFFALFMYTRLYLFNKHVAFNQTFYNNVSNAFNFYHVDKVIYILIVTLAIVNFYWGAILSNMLITKIVGYDITKYKPDPKDPFLMEIEAVKAKISVPNPKIA
jgi:hypothetical protein